MYSDIPLFLYYSLSDKYFGRSLFEVSVFLRKTETSNALAWFCQTKVWTF
jgi:hypothetical protein